MLVRPEVRKSACPHDCPSACALEVTLLPDNRRGRIAGAADHSYTAGVGALVGVDPREMDESDLIISWGGNPVSTQVNVMTHVARARKQRGAQLAVVDVYRTPTVEAADIALILRPGTDGALALAMM